MTNAIVPLSSKAIVDDLYYDPDADAVSIEHSSRQHE
jgi:hypothetical protein